MLSIGIATLLVKATSQSSDRIVVFNVLLNPVLNNPVNGGRIQAFNEIGILTSRAFNDDRLVGFHGSQRPSLTLEA